MSASLAVLREPGRADLHLHTTFSDGTHTPAGLSSARSQAGLKAVAVTDHDTTAGVEPTRAAAGGTDRGHRRRRDHGRVPRGELHLLGYFVRPDDPPLAAALADLRASRRERLREMVGRLRAGGVPCRGRRSPHSRTPVSLGRRHLARLLIDARACPRRCTRRSPRWLGRPEWPACRSAGCRSADAIALVRGAGGVASWAHPPADADLRALEELRGLGLRAVECVYPWPSRAHGRAAAPAGRRRSAWPSPAAATATARATPTRAVGARTVTLDEVAGIRRCSGQESAIRSQQSGQTNRLAADPVLCALILTHRP